MNLLTEQEITQVVRDAANGSAIRRDGSTSYRIARAIESAVIAKIKAQGPVVSVLSTEDVTKFIRKKGLHFSNHWQQLYRLPEGD